MKDIQQYTEAIKNGKTYLGIELGSTRIKAVLIDEAHQPIASGGHSWENRLENGVWTYSLEDIHTGIRNCYAALNKDVQERYGIPLETLGGMGVSGMMHGYMPFDNAGALLTPFRTWRNTITEEACGVLSPLFGFNIPQRWSIAHLYQAILNGEAHVPAITRLTTLAGYIHWQLTGEFVLGVGEASGMFPIDSSTCDFDAAMVSQFNELIQPKGYHWTLNDILPKVLSAGEAAGTLTAAGAAFLDPTGVLQPGIPLCPPEGDAGTGMTATNSVLPRTGNVSAGTSVFAMAVLERPLSRLYPEIDMVTTPAGDPVAMVHCNNCSSDLDAWVSLLREAAGAFGAQPDMNTLYNTLYRKALEADADCGGLLAYNYLSGEHVTGFNEGRPLFVRQPDSRMTLANFMRTHLYAALGALCSGMEILLKQEQVELDSITGHGGFFKVEGVGQRILAAALRTPVTVMETAGEGGPWGMAILAAYQQQKQPGETLVAYIRQHVFATAKSSTLQPDEKDAQSYAAFMEQYKKGLPVERAAVEAL